MNLYGDPHQKKQPNPFEPIEIENGVKITVPIMTNLELAELDNNIALHYNNIIHEISKTVSRDKDIIILKRIIEYQDNRIKELERKLGDK